MDTGKSVALAALLCGFVGATSLNERIPSNVVVGNPETAVISPGVAWFDTDGNRIYAGGANLIEEGGLFYLVGESEKVLGSNPSDPDLSECFNLYVSEDLAAWKNLGCILKNQDILADQPGQPNYRMERPKIFQCPTSGSWMLWFHCDTPNFSLSSVGVLEADQITGPYKFTSPCFKPDGLDSYDMGVFVDTDGDQQAYLTRSVRNEFAGISGMDYDCRIPTGIVSQGPRMEGMAIMRDQGGELHMAGSNLTGWSSNAAIFVTSPDDSLNGAQWFDNYNPSGDSTTFNSQSTFIFPYHHRDGSDRVTYIWMADRWNHDGPGGLQNSTLVWLPMLPPTPTQPHWTIQWFDSWSLGDF